MHFGKKESNSLKISYGNEENEPKTEVISIPGSVDVLLSLKEEDSYGLSLNYRPIASVGSSPELALESFTVSSDPCSFGLIVSCLRSVTSGPSDRRSFRHEVLYEICKYGQCEKRFREAC